MKGFLFTIFLLISMQNAIKRDKMIIIYFSRTGNTETFANYIKKNSNITSYKIVPSTPYPEDYNTMLNIAQEERNNNARPEIQNPLTDISQYDIVLLGYPIWYSHIPNIIITQLEKLNLNGKTIYPFNTHGGSGVGSSISDIKSYAPGATVKDGYPINGNQINSKEDDIIDWLDDTFDLDNNEDKNSNEISRTQSESGESESSDEPQRVPKINSFRKIEFKYYLLISLLILF
jgi:flavodoxin